MTSALSPITSHRRGGDVAILDGTNISRDRRKIISDKISAFKDKGYDILWIESSSVRGDDVSEQQFEELKNSPDFLDKVMIPLPAHLHLNSNSSHLAQ
jgi:6-phosphofructo-2-kinase